MDEWELEQHTVTVAQLIAKLRALPQDAKVLAIYDGFCTIDPEHVWLARGGNYVVMVNGGAPVYRDHDRPVGAPSEKDDHNWYTPNLKEDD